MLEIVKKQHPKITSRVLNRHLEDMKYINIIHRDPFRPGVDRNIWLTKNTRLILDLQMPLPKVNSKKEEKTRGSTIPKVTKEEKNKKAYLLLLSLVTTGFSTPEPVNDISKVEAGDFEIRNKPYRASATLPGFSIKDFFHEHRDILNGRRFGHVKFKDKREVEWYFKKLSEYDPQ
jgi:hypothetical protein